MFAIPGFKRGLCLGGTCDSNLAARLALYRGRVVRDRNKVLASLRHTRVAAAKQTKGTRDAKMNDQDRFIWTWTFD